MDRGWMIEYNFLLGRMEWLKFAVYFIGKVQNTLISLSKETHNPISIVLYNEILVGFFF